MIAAPPGIYALFDRGVGPKGDEMPVVAFDDDGDALIVTPEGLEVARRVRGFRRVIQLDRPLGVVPGAGWLATYTCDDGSRWSEPIVAWVINADLNGEALVHDGDGLVGRIPAEWRDLVIDHPDERDEGGGSRAA